MPSSARSRALKHLLVHRIPPPTSVTIAIRPSCGGGMGGDNHVFRKNGRGIFFARGLDTTSDYAKLICPTGKAGWPKRQEDRASWQRTASLPKRTHGSASQIRSRLPRKNSACSSRPVCAVHVRS